MTKQLDSRIIQREISEEATQVQDKWSTGFEGYAKRIHLIKHAKRTGKSKDFVVNFSSIGCTRCAHHKGTCYRGTTSRTQKKEYLASCKEFCAEELVSPMY